MPHKPEVEVQFGKVGDPADVRGLVQRDDQQWVQLLAQSLILAPGDRIAVSDKRRSAVPPPTGTLRSQPGLTANLQGFRIRAPEGWPLLQRRAPVLCLRRRSCKRVAASN